jgi:hypothetical protein
MVYNFIFLFSPLTFDNIDIALNAKFFANLIWIPLLRKDINTKKRGKNRPKK